MAAPHTQRRPAAERGFVGVAASDSLHFLTQDAQHAWKFCRFKPTLCLTMGVDEAQTVAAEALDAMVTLCTETGMVDAMRDLVWDVHAINLDRYEPEELGDTPRAFGTLCSENLRTRALRRSRHDELEPVESHWSVPGLTVSNPRNVLTLELAGARIITMKAPFGEGRRPNWERISDWETDSQVRRDLAATNSESLHYRSHAAGDVPLFPHGAAPGRVTNFMMIWAGESASPLTAAWLGVPVLGSTPFIDIRSLWWDEEPRTHRISEPSPSRGPRFDQRPAATPQVAIKPRPTATRPTLKGQA